MDRSGTGGRTVTTRVQVKERTEFFPVNFEVGKLRVSMYT